ncbi:aminotransferase class I/II-fold pyridoxal phosphate-dependent enzyme [Clostridium cylindrosporum]|uniref:Arginine decarboxylase SpeA n=1 Tax=Clostridium cylindrosporum DSM 605 TaxID=1121307 RepID=A0A0J8DA76_CLOCY|nr:aminotransferase class V-fold PLP-dependent enzyme [Clostridium cylindrosporum]KMT22950.1 arginine decarboxylase SpeA [Clostridium cylindrosporum DSM 605]
MTTPIINSLIKYNEEDNIRFHMPGHKGSDMGYDILNNIRDNLYSFDVTEVDGTDDLHCPMDSIKLSQEETAACYSAARSFYLVNGSTAGIYAMILSSVNKGDKIIIQRNCHRSVYMACFMGELNAEYIIPTVLDEFSLAVSIDVNEVKRVVENNTDAKAIVITSPTYYGTCCNISEISEIAKKYNMLLLVDSAHGAHFPFSSSLPSTSIELGADMEVVSFHKTLPALTQTGVLNISTRALDVVGGEKLQFMLSLYQSTSPSYILMSSIEAARDVMENHGEELIENVLGYIYEFRKKMEGSKIFKILDLSYIGRASIHNIDPTRIVISSSIGGVRLMELLRSDYSIQAEMADGRNIVIIGTIFDSKKYYNKLYTSLNDIETRFSSGDLNYVDNRELRIQDYTYKVKLPIFKGYSLAKEKILLEESEGRISGEMVAPYPPGIPILLPGELITNDKIKCIKACKELKIDVNGIEDKSLKTIKVIVNTLD